MGSSATGDDMEGLQRPGLSAFPAANHSAAMALVPHVSSTNLRGCTCDTSPATPPVATPSLQTVSENSQYGSQEERSRANALVRRDVPVRHDSCRLRPSATLVVDGKGRRCKLGPGAPQHLSVLHEADASAHEAHRCLPPLPRRKWRLAVLVLRPRRQLCTWQKGLPSAQTSDLVCLRSLSTPFSPAFPPPSASSS